MGFKKWVKFTIKQFLKAEIRQQYKSTITQ